MESGEWRVESGYLLTTRALLVYHAATDVKMPSHPPAFVAFSSSLFHQISYFIILFCCFLYFLLVYIYLKAPMVKARKVISNEAKVHKIATEVLVAAINIHIYK